MSKSSTIRLVIVDDHEVVRIGLCAVLNLTPGLKVIGQGKRMAEAKKLCVRLKPDLVLLDIRLPDGSGVDAAPYFRIFNPTEQIRKFDSDEKYIKKWVPEVETSSYPKPIVDHKEACERCLKVYKTAVG